MDQVLFGDGDAAHHEYAMKILREFTYQKTPEVEAEIEEMAQSIFDCPHRNSNKRSLETVRSCCVATVLDRALAEMTGFTRNSGFDARVEDSYNHDVFDGDVRMEVKRHKQRYVSWKGEKPMKTFFKHADGIGYLVSGWVTDKGDRYEGVFLMVARAPTFRKFVKDSDWGGKYYDHKKAGRAGQCIYRREIE